MKKGDIPYLGVLFKKSQDFELAAYAVNNGGLADTRGRIKRNRY